MGMILYEKKRMKNIFSPLDENFRAEVIADGDRLLLLNACSPNPCSNGGSCVTEKGRHICRCPSPFTGKTYKCYKTWWFIGVPHTLIQMFDVHMQKKC